MVYSKLKLHLGGNQSIVTCSERHKEDRGIPVVPLALPPLWEVTTYTVALSRPQQGHICTRVVQKMNRKIWLVNPTKYPFFCQRLFEAGMGLKKVSFSTRLYKRGALSHLFIRDLEAYQSKNHFCGKMELLTTILDCDASQYTQLECVKAPRFTNMSLLLSAAINLHRCIYQYAF